MSDRLLVLVRHGQSEWNLKNLFTGWRDVDLSEQGVAEARSAGRKLKAQGFRFDIAFTSALIRAQRTLDIILDEIGQRDLPVLKDQALNERDYGDLVGLNKDDARKRWGEEQVHLWRRSYDVAPPEGESLRDTAAALDRSRKRSPRRPLCQDPLQRAPVHVQAARRFRDVAAAELIDPLNMFPAHTVGRHGMLRQLDLAAVAHHQSRGNVVGMH